MRASLVRAALIASALGGCGDLRPIEPGLCGNGVLEPGEDCEVVEQNEYGCGAPDGGAACKYVCGGGSDCPGGWVCGVDQVCRQSRGQFIAREPVALPGQRTEFADFTADGFADLLTIDSDVVRIRFGPQVDLEFVDSLASTRGLGIADVNGDGATDGMVAGVDNFSILLGSAEREIQSSLHPSGNFGVGDHRLTTHPLPDPSRQLLGLPIGFATGSACQGVGDCAIAYFQSRVVPLGFAFADRAGPPAATAFGPRSPEETDVRLAMAELGATSLSLVNIECSDSNCDINGLLFGDTVSVALASGGPNEGDASAFQSPTIADGGVVFTDADGDDDDDLLVWGEDDQGRPGLGVLYNQAVENDPFTRKLVGQCDSGVCTGEPGDHCELENTVVRWASKFASTGGGSPGRLLAAGQLDGGGPVDIVTSTGIFLGRGSDSNCGFADDFHFESFGWAPAGAPWSEAVIGDFNGDGIDDVAAIAPGVSQIEIYRGNADGALTRVVVFTRSPPIALASGDLDVDGADDLAFADSTVLDGASQIFVRWGSRMGNSDLPELLGQSLPVGPGSLAMRPSVSNAGEFDADAELFIGGGGDGAGNGELTVAVVRGSPNRALASPLFSGLLALESAHGLASDIAEPGELAEGTFLRRAWCVGAGVTGEFFDQAISPGDSADIVTLGELVAVADLEVGGPSPRRRCEATTGVRFPVLEARVGEGSGNVAGSAPWCNALPRVSGRTVCAYLAQMSALQLPGRSEQSVVIVAPLDDRDNGISCSTEEQHEDSVIIVASVAVDGASSPLECISGFEFSTIGLVSGALRGITRSRPNEQGDESLLVVTDREVVHLAADSLEGISLTGVPSEGCSILAGALIESGCNRDTELALLESCDGVARAGLWTVDWEGSLTAEQRVELDLGAPAVAPGMVTSLAVADLGGDGLVDLLVRVGDSGTLFVADQAPPLGTEDVCGRR